MPEDQEKDPERTGQPLSVLRSLAPHGGSGAVDMQMLRNRFTTGDRSVQPRRPVGTVGRQPTRRHD